MKSPPTRRLRWDRTPTRRLPPERLIQRFAELVSTDGLISEGRTDLWASGRYPPANEGAASQSTTVSRCPTDEKTGSWENSPDLHAACLGVSAEWVFTTSACSMPARSRTHRGASVEKSKNIAYSFCPAVWPTGGSPRGKILTAIPDPSRAPR